MANNIVSDIESIADQVLLMKEGRLLRVNGPQALIAAIPDTWEPVAYHLSLEDVYLWVSGNGYYWLPNGSFCWR